LTCNQPRPEIEAFSTGGKNEGENDGSALAALLCCVSVESRANVTLYGVVDAGVSFTNNQVGGGSVVRQTSGSLSSSRWGVRGSEDLGQGLKAVFVLESGFDVDTGKSAQGGRLFGRSAYVGLESQWGSILFGRQRARCST
jgi:predicted porin